MVHSGMTKVRNRHSALSNRISSAGMQVAIWHSGLLNQMELFSPRLKCSLVAPLNAEEDH